jgi:hypothetical protein
MRQLVFRSVVVAAVIGAITAAAAAFAENVDPANDGSQYAWGENVGWINAEPAISGTPIAQGVTVSGYAVTGFMWGENVGWINLSCQNNGTCAQTGNYGVTNDNAGNLGGYAWGENVGWISFSCNNNPSTCASTGSYGVHINPATGEWSGTAWGENIGWINFSHSQTANRVQTDDGDNIDPVTDNCDFDNNPSQSNTDAANTGLGFPGSDLLGDACDIDDDGDGCADVEETGTDILFGGQRNPLLLYDFYDINGSKKVDAFDINVVRSKFNGVGPTPPGDRIYDRSIGAHPWASGPPDNKINGIDVNLVRVEFNHSCQNPP